MKATKRILALLLATIMLCSALTACGKKPAASTGWDGTPQYGGHLNVKMISLAMLDPMKNASTWRYMYTTCVYDPFLTRDSDYNIMPAVCDYELNEDQTVLKLWPREGYVFSRGYGQVEIDDLVASWNRGTMYNSVKNNVFPNIISQEVVMDEELGHEVFRVEFKYNERNMYYLASIKTWWPVMPKEICEKYEGEYIDDQVEDVVGTGPYIVSEFKSNDYCTLTKRDDYVPYDQGDATGLAGTKYGYMDSITFIQHNDTSGASASLAGQLDLNEVIPAEYYDAAAASGLKLTKLVSDQRVWLKFNTNGTNNLIAKYPPLRKAILAAFDYQTYAGYITDDSLVMDGDNIMIYDIYDVTDKFKAADYYGAANPEVAQKYLDEARAMGYNGEKIQIPYSTARTDIITMTAASMEAAGIPYEVIPMEAAVHTEFIGSPENNWDFEFGWINTYPTPGVMPDSMVKQNFKSDRVQEIRQEMLTLIPTSDEYLALWDEWTDIWVEECQLGYIGAIDWWWWHPETLHINDGGDDPNDGNYFRYVYNCYWEDPANHSEGYIGSSN